VNSPKGLVNISTRLAIGVGEDVLIGGFIIAGDAPKKVILRGMGPSLKAGSAAFPGTLQDPAMDLYDGKGKLLLVNDNWRDSQEKEIAATTIPPSDDREAAIVATLTPGAYTAILHGKDNAMGIGLIELYDLGATSSITSVTSNLANISTRGFVQTGDKVIIAGFIISEQATKVIVRGVGPELGNAGINAALQDTTLDLVDGNGVAVASNDDWRSEQEQEISDTSLAPNDDREAAIVATLKPAAYTAVLRGKGATTGVGLVEVYLLQ
jgi:hypothetical protein